MTVLEAGLPLARSRAADLVDLTKPRITLMILLTALLGYTLGAGGSLGLVVIPLLAGTALIASGSSVLNQYLERDLDGRMRRTEGRPLPAGRLRPGEALRFGVVLSVAGLGVLLLLVNLLTGLLAAATLLSYVAVYTPLKRHTSLATIVGAVPGALPPVGGWAAATGRIGPEAAILFALVFLWQIPHFLAIAHLYREDYRRSGMPMLPVLEPDGRATARQVSLYASALLPVSLLPSVIGLAGPLYLAGALILGLAFAGFGLAFARNRTLLHARRLLLASVIYLPLLSGLLMIDQAGR